MIEMGAVEAPMMKRLLAATGLVACMTTVAIAQDDPADYGVAVKDVVKGT